MNNKGRGPGLALILVLIVALIVAYLAVTQMGSIGIGGQEIQTEERQQIEDSVDAAQDAVDAINEKIELEGE